jgi:zinc transporter
MPVITRFGDAEGRDDEQSSTITWIDIDISENEDREWLSSWDELDEQTRTYLLEPVSFSRREHLADGMFLGVRALKADEADGRDDTDELVDLKLLLGKSRVVTVRSGEVAAVEKLRRNLRSSRNLQTPVDLLAFMVASITKRMEGVIFNISRDTDVIEDQLLDENAVPSPESMNELRRRIFRNRRLLNSVKLVLAPIATDPVLALDAGDRETLNKSSDHVARHLEGLEDCRARIQMLQDQIDALHSATMTRSSLNLSIVATVFLPLTFVTGLLGMNVAGIPDAHNPWGFWVVCVASIVIAGLAWLVLHRHMGD